jgi:hypothetical protein
MRARHLNTRLQSAVFIMIERSFTDSQRQADVTFGTNRSSRAGLAMSVDWGDRPMVKSALMTRTGHCRSTNSAMHQLRL